MQGGLFIEGHVPIASEADGVASVALRAGGAEDSGLSLENGEEPPPLTKNPELIEYVQAPILRVTGFDTPFPYTLEHVYMPDADRVLRAILQTHRFVS